MNNEIIILIVDFVKVDLLVSPLPFNLGTSEYGNICDENFFSVVKYLPVILLIYFATVPLCCWCFIIRAEQVAYQLVGRGGRCLMGIVDYFQYERNSLGAKLFILYCRRWVHDLHIAELVQVFKLLVTFMYGLDQNATVSCLFLYIGMTIYLLSNSLFQTKHERVWWMIHSRKRIETYHSFQLQLI